MPSKVSSALEKFRTSGAAQLFASFALISQVCAGVLISLVAFRMIYPEQIQTVEKIIFIAISLGIFFTGLVIFVLRQFIIYVTRLFLTWISIFSSFGYVLYVAKRVGTPYLESLAFSTLVLFIVTTVVFYSGIFAFRVYIKITGEHMEGIDRIEDQVSQVSKKIPPSESEQLTKLILNTRRSLSKLTRELFIRAVDAPKAFYTALLLSLVFFAVAYFSLSYSITIFGSGMHVSLLLATLLFTIVIILIDTIRLEKTRQTLIKG